MQSAFAALGKGKPSKGDGLGKGAGGRFGYSRVQWNLPAIIATGLIWPANTPLTWDNPERKGCADGTDDGLFGLKCPFCGHNRTREMSREAFIAANNGLRPGTGPGKVPCPTEVALLHRALECSLAPNKVERFLRENPSHRDDEAFQPMTAEQLATFKAAGG
jgi:hypothetical protein